MYFNNQNKIELMVFPNPDFARIYKMDKTDYGQMVQFDPL